jgi:LuxR family transcriptional regulator, maltose regulon positive regulatory protein
VVSGALGHYPSTSAVHAARARLALHRRDLGQARTSADEALALYQKTGPTAFPWLAAQLALALGTIAVELDDHPAALHRMAEARRHIARLPVAGTLVHDSAKLAADLARNAQRLRHPATLTAAEMRVLQLLPTHLTLSEIAEELYISRNTVKTQVASIYGKLHSSTRGEAVRTARERDLIKYD